VQRRKFAREFKLEAVKLIRDRGVSCAQASQDLGVQLNVLGDFFKFPFVPKSVSQRLL
jgi:transposase